MNFDNEAVYSDSSVDDEFSFGILHHDDFNSDSDGEATNVVVEMD